MMSKIKKDKRLKQRNNDESKTSLKALCCNANLGPKDPRVSLIHEAIKDEDVKNIAVIGPYGSGKSSIISSFIKSYNLKKNSIFFSYDSLGHFKKGANNSNNEGKYQPEFDNLVRAIFYELLRCNTKSILLDKFFSYLFKSKKELWLFIFFIVVVLTASFVGTYFLFNLIGWVSIFVGISFFFLILYLYFSLSIKSIKGEVKALNGLDIVAEWERKNNNSHEKAIQHPAYAENMIIKQLADKDIQFIIFEDLDRLEPVGYIDCIKDLKNFNDLINRSNEFKDKEKRVVFIYACKDERFLRSTDRTKYFDLIVPVVPYATFSNAADSILQDDFIKKNVSENIVVNLSSYLLDQRQVNAVITQFNINKDVTYSSDILNELFALTIFNVRFPSAYSNLFEKSNFLFPLIKSFEKDKNLFENFNIDNAPSNERAELKTLRNIINNLELSDKEDFVLFIKTCVIQKYLTANFENLLHSNIENGLAVSDLKYIHSFLAGDYDRYYSVVNPGSLLSHIGDSAVLFSNKNGLNVCLIKFILDPKTKINNHDKCKNALKQTLNDMSNDEIAEFLNNIPDLDLIKTLYSTLVDGRLLTNFSLYYSAPLIKDEETRNAVCVNLFNSYNKSHYTQTLKMPNEYCRFINSKYFIDLCGQQLAISQTQQFIMDNYFYPESLVNLNANDEILNNFASKNCYVKNFTNLCVVYEGFASKPLKHIVTNDPLLDELIKDKESLLQILNLCNLENTEDDAKNCIAFIDKVAGHSLYEVLDSDYFNQWKHKLIFVVESTNKYVQVLKRQLLDFSDQTSIDSVIKVLPNEFVKSVCNDISYFSKQKFSNYASWILVSKIEESDIGNLKNALTLSEAVFHISSITNDKIKVILKFVGKEEKARLLTYLMSNNPSLIVESFLEQRIEVADLQDIKINSKFLDYIFQQNAHGLLNACLNNNNHRVTKEYMTAHPEEDYNKMFIGDNGEILQTEDVDLIVQFCVLPKRDFDFVRKLITSLSSDKLDDVNKWKKFFESFNLKKDNKEKKFLYYENNENNRILINFFKDNELIKNVKFINNNTEIRVTIN